MLSWLFGHKKSSARNETVAFIDNGNGQYSIDVVGESHYQNSLSQICGGKTEEGHRCECIAYLILENENPYDTEAVRVDIDGLTIGHLSRKNARNFRRELKKAAPDISVAKCPAMIIGGWSRNEGRDQGHFGVKLDLPEA